MKLSLTAQAKLWAAFHSFWITGIAIAGGMVLDAVARGAATPRDLLYYARVHWLAWVVANLATPMIRAIREPAVVPSFPPDTLDVPDTFMPSRPVASGASLPIVGPNPPPGKGIS